VGFGDWDVVERGFFALDFDPDCLIFNNFLQCFLFLSIGRLGIDPLGVLSLSRPSQGNIG
jgi:hypothetical protein